VFPKQACRDVKPDVAIEQARSASFADWFLH
jgi:hypothetical protein